MLNFQEIERLKAYVAVSDDGLSYPVLSEIDN